MAKQRAERYLPAERYGVSVVASIPETFALEKVLSLRSETLGLETEKCIPIFR